MISGFCQPLLFGAIAPPNIPDRISRQQQRSHPHLMPNEIASLPSQQQGAIAFPRPTKRDRVQPLQQQLEAWQAMRSKFEGTNE